MQGSVLLLITALISLLVLLSQRDGQAFFIQGVLNPKLKWRTAINVATLSFLSGLTNARSFSLDHWGFLGPLGLPWLCSCSALRSNAIQT